MSDKGPSKAFLALEALVASEASEFLNKSYWCPYCREPIITGLSIVLVKNKKSEKLFWRLGISAASAVKQLPCETSTKINRILERSTATFNNLKSYWRPVDSPATLYDIRENNPEYTMLPRMTIEQFQAYLHDHHPDSAALFETTIKDHLWPFILEMAKEGIIMRSDD